MYDSVNIIQIRKTFKNGQRDLTHNVDIDGSNLLVNPVERTLIHKFHANAYVRIRQESAIERYDELGIAVMHDL